MKLDATYRFDAEPAEVWAVLLDIEAIAACLPGCEELRPTGDNAYRADLAIGVGPVSGRFTAAVALEDLTPPLSYALRMEASGAPGFVRGHASVRLSGEETGTRVAVEATADVGGTIARVGQRLLMGVARSTMERFFECLRRRLDQRRDQPGAG
jgi:carbon monoxide dehydrogenase subunit G